MFQRIGLALRILRELSGTSQAALARKAGIGKSQLSKYETNKDRPKFDALEKLLSALEVRPVLFFYVAELLERVAREELSMEALVTSEPGPLIDQNEREGYARVLLDLTDLYEAQIVRRVRSAITNHDKQREG
jgi:transcriptional regulator with XRE-family HTH domain